MSSLSHADQIAEFQNITNINDAELCERVLEAHNWNLQAAIEEALGGDFPASTSRVEGSSEFRSENEGLNYRRNVAEGSRTRSSPAQRPVVEPRPPGGIVSTVVGVGGALARFVGGFLPQPLRGVFGGPQPTTVAGSAASGFVSRFEREYGSVHPPFVECSYADAIERCKREFKFLLVYLHSEQHQNTQPFCRQVLRSEAVIELVRENFVMWGGSVRQSEAYQASNQLRATTFPFLAVIAVLNNQPTLLDRKQGEMTVDEVLSWLVSVVDTYGPHLDAARIEAEERETERQLRSEQDQAYHQSLLNDQIREQERQEQLRRAEEEQRRAEEERIAAQRAEHLRMQQLEALQTAKAAKRGTFGPEPARGAGAVEILFRLPDGSRLSRRFLPTDSLNVVFEWVWCQEMAPNDDFVLVSSYPKRTFRRPDDVPLSLNDAQLTGHCTLFVNPVS